MWKVIVFSQANEKLLFYINRYHRYLSDPFVDTGIWSEGMIREQYVQASKKLYDILHEGIISRFQKEILPYEWIRESENIKKTCIFLEKRAVFVEYIEDKKTDTRYIRDINIIYHR